MRCPHHCAQANWRLTGLALTEQATTRTSLDMSHGATSHGYDLRHVAKGCHIQAHWVAESQPE